MLSPFHALSLSFSLLALMMAFITIMSLNFKINNSLIISIFMLNMLGLIPDFWSPTSYLWGNLLIGFITWMLYSMNKLFKDLKFWMSHMLPYGSPIFLWPFLTILEIISQLIRPVTLSLRLTCNLMAGHVMLSLITSVKYFGLMLMLIILFFEMCVALIQSIVFNLLLESYKSELN
uniref:ATP synthase subunit a n=1 Tax=Hexamermis agrotis TaxID=387665 RepID=A2TN49_9BILA|nr:ATP synthase F0 subunit 6 [Hexamermis agrotis]YP_001023666.1 ATP synthase F0 subunit 6 [Hexamermis agrotis]YP_001023667.1 ATP synthase F0 subunit 6 [Hexamermis agrotis]ABM79866.1 ATP synthase F0 subunit 6 [Hexamermis agrotis]ABM79867.1 ATP synthase F0 subunit 6 [Hexamermis agrotis]ABM79868.1 ATP synthase F0 subunit 6 [Hexamermis agrotis]